MKATLTFKLPKKDTLAALEQWLRQKIKYAELPEQTHVAYLAARNELHSLADQRGAFWD
jgi:hypothetical protein